MEELIRPPRLAILLLFFLSGFSGLILELAWARRLSLLSGNGIQATAAVVALTIAGLALGSRWAGRRADESANPLFRFAFLEAGISLWAFATPVLFHLLRRIAAMGVSGGEGTADLSPGAFLATAVMLVPGSFLMGATTPFLVRHGSGHWHRAGRAQAAAGSGGILLGPLYGWNTLGGAAGALATVFVLLPRLGISGTTMAAGLLDLSVAATVVLLTRRGLAERRPFAAASISETASPASPSVTGRGRVLSALVAAGFLGGICQMVWTRLLVLFFGSSTHALGITLAACLAGLALGSTWAGRRLVRRVPPRKLARGAFVSLAAATCLSLPLWGKAPALIVLAQGRLGSTFAGALALQVLLSLLLLFPVAFCLGAILPALTALLGGGGHRAGKDSGDGYSLDSWGSVAGALAAAFLLLPGIGVEWTIRLTGLAAVLLFVLIPAEGSRPPRSRAIFARRHFLPAGCVAFLLLLPRWDPVLMTSGPLLYASTYRGRGEGIGRVEEAMRRRGPLRFLGEGPDATVTVREGAGGILSLQINGKTDASTGPDLPTQVLAGRLPALLHPGPRRVLVIGLASGTTVGALLTDPTEWLDCVEISPEVVRAASLFSSVNGGALQDARLHLHLGDGRAYLQRTHARYDLITSQPTNPWIAGVTNLFTLEFFQLAKERLADGGILGVWLQGYALDPGDFRAAVATLSPGIPAGAALGGIGGGRRLLSPRMEERRTAGPGEPGTAPGRREGAGAFHGRDPGRGRPPLPIRGGTAGSLQLFPRSNLD